MVLRVCPSLSDKEIATIDELVWSGYARSRSDFARLAIIRFADYLKSENRPAKTQTPDGVEFSAPCGDPDTRRKKDGN